MDIFSEIWRLLKVDERIELVEVRTKYVEGHFAAYIEHLLYIKENKVTHKFPDTTNHTWVRQMMGMLEQTQKELNRLPSRNKTDTLQSLIRSAVKQAVHGLQTKFQYRYELDIQSDEVKEIREKAAMLALSFKELLIDVKPIKNGVELKMIDAGVA